MVAAVTWVMASALPLVALTVKVAEGGPQGESVKLAGGGKLVKMLGRRSTLMLTPYEMERHNPSAIRGNMIGGSAIPEQSGMNRPLPGIITRGVSRSFVPGLYLSNSIEPFGATHLASGYLTACEVAEDMGCREASWWQAQPYVWFFENMAKIPLNLGVGPGVAR